MEKLRWTNSSRCRTPAITKCFILSYILMVLCELVVANTHHSSHHGATTFMPALECYDRSNKPQVNLNYERKQNNQGFLFDNSQPNTNLLTVTPQLCLLLLIFIEMYARIYKCCLPITHRFNKYLW